jgi:hypothetical protein
LPEQVTVPRRPASPTMLAAFIGVTNPTTGQRDPAIT